MEVGSDLEAGDSDEDAAFSSKKKTGESKEARRKKIKVENLKEELKELLQVKLSARGVSHKYLTGGSTGFVKNLLEDKRESWLVLDP